MIVFGNIPASVSDMLMQAHRQLQIPYSLTYSLLM